MNSCFYSLKKKIQLLVISTNLIAFIIITILINIKETNYIEYTSLSKYFPNIYIFMILTMLLIDLIYPKLLHPVLSENLAFLRNDNGKLLINFAISILYWSSNNIAHVIFGIITFVSSFALFLCEFIFQCKILDNKIYDEEYNEKINKNNSFNNENNNELNLINQLIEK